MTIKKFMLIPAAVILLGLAHAPSTFATTVQATSKGVQQYAVQATTTLLTVDGTKTVSTSPTSSTTTWNTLEGVDGYDIYQATSLNGEYSFIATRANTVSSITLKGLTTNKTYYYKVRANKFVNGKNIYSNTTTFSAISYATIGTTD